MPGQQTSGLSNHMPGHLSSRLDSNAVGENIFTGGENLSAVEISVEAVK